MTHTIHINSITSPIFPTPNNTPTNPNADQFEKLMNLMWTSEYIISQLKNSDDFEETLNQLWDIVKNDPIFITSSESGEIFHITNVNDIINNWGFYAPFV